MNASSCIRRGLQSVACCQEVLRPQVRQWVVQGRCSASWNGVRKVMAVRVGGAYRRRCASSEAGGRGAQVTEEHTRRLIMYSKPGCCLCDGLKEKLSTLPNVELEIRNILTKPEWENAYQYEIPVLAHVKDDGTEETIPRLSPRLSAEQMKKKLEAVVG